MAAARVRCECAIVCIGFGRVGEAEALAVSMGDGRLSVTVSVEDDLWEETAMEASAGNDSDSLQDDRQPIMVRCFAACIAQALRNRWVAVLVFTTFVIHFLQTFI